MSRSSNLFLQFSRRQTKTLNAFTNRNFYSSAAHLKYLSTKRALKGHQGCVNAIEFNKSGSLIITGSDDTSVRIWDTYSMKCKAKYYGHCSNVFATQFFQSQEAVVSGGNDGDLRYYDISSGICNVISHHSRKVLSIVLNEDFHKNSFFSSSGDGTIRHIDTRKKYKKMKSEKIRLEQRRDDEEEKVIPQIWGGGRRSNWGENEGNGFIDSLLVKFPGRETSLYNINLNPANSNEFVCSCSDGCAYLYDLRKIKDKSWESYVNVFRNCQSSHSECTGASFNYDGTKIVTTVLTDCVYVFDKNKNYQRKYNIDYHRTIYGEYKEPGILTETPEPKIEIEEKKSNDIMMEDKNKQTSEQEELNDEKYYSSGSEFSGEEEGEIEFENEENGEEEFLFGEDDDDEEEGESFNSILDLLRMSDYIETQNRENERKQKEKKTPLPCKKTFKQKINGRVSIQTLKGVWWYGPKSEYIISGSDCSNIFIWDSESGELLRILSGHDQIVNTVTPHPRWPILASSGLDHYVKLWEPLSPFPSDDELKARETFMDDLIEKNGKENSRERNSGISIIDLFSMLARSGRLQFQ